MLPITLLQDDFNTCMTPAMTGRLQTLTLKYAVYILIDHKYYPHEETPLKKCYKS